MEFVINNAIKIHPMALIHFEGLQDRAARTAIAEMTQGYDDKTEYFVDFSYAACRASLRHITPIP